MLVETENDNSSNKKKKQKVDNPGHTSNWDLCHPYYTM